MQDKYVFSDAQALSTLDSTGVVSANIFDMELTKSGGSTIITNDQVDAYLNVLIVSTTNTGGTEGIDVQLRESDNSDMATGAAVLGSVHIKQAGIAAGKKYSVRIKANMTMCYLGAWILATNTSLNNATGIDIWLSDTPVGENEDIQKTSVNH